MKDSLHLVLKHIWFEKIKSGEKNSEYRECKEYWNKKFQPFVDGARPLWKKIVFHDGYTNVTVKRELLSISVTKEKNDLNQSQVWELKLGKILY